MKFIKKYGMWILSVGMLLFGIAFMPSIASLIFIIGGLAALPIAPLQEFLRSKGLKGAVKGVFVAVLFLVGCVMAPSDSTDKADDIPALETVAETPTRTFETPDEAGQRLADEAAAEDAREQAALVELQEIPAETVQEISATQEEPAKEETPAAEPEPVAPEERSTPTEAETTVEEPTPEPEPPKEPVKVSATVHGTSRTISLDSGSLVWLSATGEKFHSINNCGNMNPEKARQVEIDYAVNHHFDACEKCW